MSSKTPVTVVGAGVIGLQTALLLQQSGAYSVTIVAEHWPFGDNADISYASPQAGGHWRPQNPHDRALDIPTYHHWLSLSHIPASVTGLRLVPAVCYWETATAETAHNARDLWWRHIVGDFRVLPPSELPAGTVFGVAYSTFAINPTVYMQYMLNAAVALGAKMQRRKIGRLGELGGAVVNCSGFAAGVLVGDTAVTPTKGQTVLVAGEASRMVFRETVDGWHDVVIVRPGAGTILGVSKSYGDMTTEEDEEVTRRILERGREMAPELLVGGEFRVLTVNVGRRPARSGGVRIEVERNTEGVVVHQYGHGGGGFQNSYGSALKACELLDQALAPREKL